jgi:formylglycine-generating enzyme required for sulfatase activity
MKHTLPLLLLVLFTALVSGCSTPSFASGPPLIIDPGIDPDQWADIPAGEFLQGQFEHEVMLDHDYQMMVTPVTNQQFVFYLNQALADGTLKLADNRLMGYYPGDEFHGYRHEVEITAGDWLQVDLEAEGLRYTFDGSVFTVLPGYEKHPVVSVTWFGALGYCQYYGWRLPSELEWEKAARGTDARPYPWGDEIGFEYANFYSSRDPFEAFLGKSGDTTPVGFYNGGNYDGFETVNAASPYGLYDMAGNVEEWTGNVYEKQHYRYMRGGSKANYGYELRVWVSNNAEPDYFGPSIGFRCARDVQP